jgi:hypothetical protein
MFLYKPEAARSYFLSIGFLKVLSTSFVLYINYNVRLQDPILLLIIPTGTRKKFAENCRQFGHALSRRLASPVSLCL